MPVRGIRGVVVSDNNTPDSILRATSNLLIEIISANPTLHSNDIASVLFTTTHDLDQAYPAQAARQIGWTHVPLLCSSEIPVSGSLPKCIRVLILWNTRLSQKSIHHVYLGEAAKLRPDLVE